MKRRLVLSFAVLVAALIGAGGLTAKRVFRAAPPAADPAAPDRPDSAETAAWRGANPWLFREEGLSGFRDNLLLPFARRNSLAPRNVRRSGEFVEAVFPRGRPIHAIAHELEIRAARAGFRVAEGREIGASTDRVEYRLEDGAGRPFALRIVLGGTVLPGSFRMALVITDVGRASAADLRAWLDFPLPVTLVFPDTLAAPERVPARGAHSVERDVLIELPMEPAAYPHVKPGPRALFIDFTREQAERVLRARLEGSPGAAGFATRHGDRAIEHPALMEYVLDFVAERSLVFLDLTGSSRSLTSAVSIRSGALGYVSAAREPGSEKALESELERLELPAKKSGEGIWVLRHAPGLPAALFRVAGARSGAGGPRWVTLRGLRREAGE